ncbi:TPA: hypothetical protein ACQZKP_004598 [Klebsiella quasipneumoniae subsp. similipneumoniae]|uniref:hypothetical protein n=1 Tax=Klebsiella quasipneumoniae TaxID=1463165 RepID=UPI00177AAC1E|nr:hypothetical protein [Klebsiella quasipneumoniae]MBD8835613.1 hypothetical protein [Klebsiella quasipneumoniae]MBE5246324.1 hypothetical protein [Klebsiella quasipneumoniae]HBX7937684.1 hypothetical protein [Klebsiella pneumoniae]
MFTVKQIINNATSLYEAKEITVARQGSEQWRQAFALADELEVQTPDIIEHIPMSYEDPEMTKPIGDEHQLSVERSGVSRSDCIAIICTGIPSPALPDIPELGGVGYQFLYKGDQIYITNRHGATIETVK